MIEISKEDKHINGLISAAIQPLKDDIDRLKQQERLFIKTFKSLNEGQQLLLNAFSGRKL